MLEKLDALKINFRTKLDGRIEYLIHTTGYTKFEEGNITLPFYCDFKYLVEVPSHILYNKELEIKNRVILFVKITDLEYNIRTHAIEFLSLFKDSIRS